MIYIKNIALFVLSGIFFISAMIILFYIFSPLPSVEIENIASKQSIQILDRNGKFLFDFSEEEKRTFIDIENTSKNIINATIAIEDHNFFTHKGISLIALLRATITNIFSGSFVQGGSTITQQVVKNVFLQREKKIKRKLKEIILSFKLENQLSKEKIIELYLNTISYGGVSYGISEASKTFFGKDPSEVTIAEAAYLASIPNAPTYFSPYGKNKRDLESRKNIVLEKMLNYNFITQEEYIKAKNESVYFQSQDKFAVQAPHFVFFVKENLEKEYGSSLNALEGKTLITTLDLDLQKEVEKLIKNFAPTIEERYGAKNLASIVLDTKTGDILSMVGSKDFFDTKIDGSVNIITSLRQPGSTFKPIVYATAFEKGLGPNTIVFDVPTQFAQSCDKDRFESTKGGCYSPVNYTGDFVGPISLRNALARSINIPAVKTLYIANIKNVIKLAKSMGITSFNKNPEYYGLSLVLGGAEITPLELAQAYSVFSNEGVLIPTRWNPKQEIVEKKVLDKNVARDITSILSDDIARAPTFGFNSSLNIKSPEVAVKTGTTNNSRDIWIVGYSPDIVVLIWAGNSRSELLEDGASGFSLSPLFRDIMIIATNKFGNTLHFNKNTEIKTSVNELINFNDPHTILHNINKNILTQKPVNPKNDPQYENWEFAVQSWLKENEIDEININIEKIKNFKILYPKKNRKLYIDDFINIEVTNIPLKNTQYEFYINDKFIVSSSINMFSFSPKNHAQGVGEIKITVIVNTNIGNYTSEQIYQINH